MATRKRGQSEGSIYRRKDGYWVGAVSLGGGTRKTVYAKVRADVVRKVDAIRANLTQGIQPANDRMTVEDVVQQWVNGKRQTVRPGTFEAYSGLLRKHVIPHIGNHKLAKVSPAVLERFYRTRSESVSAQTIRNLHFVLKQAFDWAVRRDWIARNPVRLIAPADLPRVTRKPATVLSPEQAQKLIDVSKGTKSETLITLALTTGARVSELLGLTWDRVDLLDESKRKPAQQPSPGQVRIDRALQYRDGEPILVEPKTRAGRRTLTLTRTASGPLRQLRSQQNKTALRLSKTKAWKNDLDLVFTTETGRPLTRHAALYQYLRPLLSEAGLPAKLKFHDLRHVAASLLLADGIPVPIVSEMLGHANPSITMSIYSHALPDSQDIAASAMDALLGN